MINRKKFALALFTINVCIIGLSYSITYSLKLKGFVEFLADYSSSIGSKQELLSLNNDVEILNKLLQISKGETDTVAKMSLGLTQELVSLLLLNAALFILLLSISLLMLLAYNKKNN